MAAGNIKNPQDAEIILAQEQSVIYKAGPEREYQGTLILTNKRLLFVAANQEQDFSVTFGVTRASLRFADVRDLNSIPRDPANLSIPLSELDVEKGHERLFRLPTLKIKWREGGEERSAEFTEDIAGAGRKKDLKDWARVIESMKTGKIHIQLPNAPTPSVNTLEGRLLYILNDMQEKGTFEMEKEIEDTFKVEDIDPDELDAACQKLVSQGFLDEIKDSSGDNFYKKRSMLGEDDLSS